MAPSASILTPPNAHSPGAGEMHDAYVVFAVVAVILIVAVNAALIMLVLRNRAARGREATERGPGGGGTPRLLLGGLGVLALALLVLGIAYDDRARGVPVSDGASASSPPLQVRVAGQQWLWRYTYPDGTFNYYELVVPVGRTVRLNIDSTDVVHRWWVPELAGMTEAVPGRINPVYFRADEPGVYDGQSSAFSGASYSAMRIRVRAVPDSEFQSWLNGQKRDLIAAQEAVQKAAGEPSAPLTDPSAALTPGVAPKLEATP